MPALFILDVSTDPAARRATLQLKDGDGIHNAAHEVVLDAHPPSVWSGLFDTQRHIVARLDCRNSVGQLADSIRQSAARGETFTFDPLADLLTRPAFARSAPPRLGA